MKATGIVRKVDHLGRIVLPIELRRTFNINVGDSLEIFCDESGMICLRKYNIKGVEQLLKEFQDGIQKDTSISKDAKDYILSVTDRAAELIKEG